MIRLLLALLLHLSLGVPTKDDSQNPNRADPLLWGALSPGPHPVGFQSYWEFDPARVYDHTFEDGTHYADGKEPRPILVNLWYPAADEEADAPRMTHRRYLELDAERAALARLVEELEEYERNVIVEWALEAKPAAMSDWEKEQLDRLLDARTPCIRDAAPAAGPFPLVLYHAGYGSSYEDNSVLCEYLASHGYVVAGSAFLDESGESFNIDGKEGSVRDLAFLVRRLAGESNVDWKRVGVAGHSGGAHASLAFQAEPMAAVDAAVSLDTTQDYVSALDPHWSHPRKMLADIAHQTAPLLVVARPIAFFQVCDQLIGAERYYLTFHDLDHNDYTSQGVLTAEFSARRAAAESKPDAAALEERAKGVRRGFEQCCETVKLFFDCTLANSARAREELSTHYRSTPFAGAEPHIEYVPVGSVGPEPFDRDSAVPPTPRQFFQLLGQGAGDEALEILQRCHGTFPSAPIFDDQFAYAVMFDCVARGRDRTAATLAPYFRELHPDLMKLFLWWVDRGGDKYREEFNRPALKAAQLLEPDNEEVAKRLGALGESGSGLR